MPWRGPAAFLLFWVVALGVGSTFVLAVVGGGFGWLALLALPAFVLLLIMIARTRRGP
jgi:hypothetical protein